MYSMPLSFNKMKLVIAYDQMYVVPNDLVWFGLVSLFNGISTFVGYLMPKLFS